MGYSNYINLLEELENTKQMLKQHLLLVDRGFDKPLSAGTIICVVEELENFQNSIMNSKLYKEN